MPINTPEALNTPLSHAVNYLLWAAAREGKSIGIASGRRTYEEQVDLRRNNCGTSQHAIYDMDSMDCDPPTARPGESRHETGDAVDLSGDVDWAFNKLQPLGFTRPVPGEDWHFEHPKSRHGGEPEKVIAAADVAGKLADKARREGNLTEAEAAGVVGLGQNRSGIDVGPVYLPSPGRIAEGFVDGITDPIDAVASALGALGGLAGNLLNAEFWKRIGLGAVGLGLVWLAAWIVVSGSITEALGNVAAAKVPVPKNPTGET